MGFLRSQTIYRYANLIKFGVVNSKDKDIRSLASMICGSNDRSFSNLRYLHNVISVYDLEDIISELRILFLKACLKFQKHRDVQVFVSRQTIRFAARIQPLFKKRTQHPPNRQNTIHKG